MKPPLQIMLYIHPRHDITYALLPSGLVDVNFDVLH